MARDSSDILGHGSLLMLLGKKEPSSSSSSSGGEGSMSDEDNTSEKNSDSDDSSDMTLHMASEELLSAVESKDAQAVAKAFRVMFDCLSGKHNEESSEEQEDNSQEY